MHHWFVAFTYRENSEGSIKFGNCVINTLNNIFSFPHISQELADRHMWSDVQILNWKELSQMEYMAYQQWENQNDSSN